jgi:polyhydroxybutyrate depolymerase
MIARRLSAVTYLFAAACNSSSSSNGAMPQGTGGGAGAAGGATASGTGGATSATDAAIGATGGSSESDATASADAPDTPAKTETATIMTEGGRPRIVIVHSPPNLRGPAALVFNLHGSGGTAAAQESYSNMDASADRLGFIAAYGQGDIASGGGFVWNVPGQPLGDGSPVPAGAADDIAYFAQAIATLEQSYPVDPKRIYFSGFSGGGRMTSQVGCDLSTTVAAIAPVAGLRFPVPCNSARQVPVVAFHGTADSVNPYNGNGAPYWTEGVPAAEQHWGAHNGCGATLTTSPVVTGVQLAAYPMCNAGADVELYVTEGADHIWPGAPGQNDPIDATSLMWAFFVARPLP